MLITANRLAVSTQIHRRARQLLHGALGLLLLLPCFELECAPRVVTGLIGVPSASFATPPPTVFWAAIIDPATLSKTAQLPAVLGGNGALGAADAHGHRAYFAGSKPPGTAIEVVDTRTGLVEAVVGVGSFLANGLATDPVRARLYIVTSSPQPGIVVLDTRSFSLLPPIALQMVDSVSAGPVITPDGTLLFLAFGSVLVKVGLPEGTIIQSTTLPFETSSIALNANRNELYLASNTSVSGSVFVVAMDSLQVMRTFSSDATLDRIEVRPTDGALLVESEVEGDTINSRLDVVDPEMGGVVATSANSGRGVSPSIDGREVYRFQRGAYTVGAPYGNTSSSLVVLNALTLAPVGSVVLDTRAENDPLRQILAIVGTSAVSVPQVSLAVEYHYPALGHYFITSIPAEIDALDAGRFPGWQRTGETLPVYAQRGDGPDGTVPVCRFYGLPEKGLDAHFYSASASECAEVQQRFGDSWLLESSDVFEVYSADAVTGVCPFETVSVYRVHNNRPDANHRYTTSLAIRDSMLQAGWIPEGYGLNAVAFCVPR